MPPKIAIDKTVVATLPVVTYPGRVHVIDSTHNLDAAVRVLENSPLVGFDTETRPSFKRGDHHKMALIQLGNLDDCFLFRVNKIGVPDRLAQYLANPDLPKVGLSTQDDFNGLRRISDVKPAGFTELQKMVGQWGIQDISLQKIYAILFGEKISKGQRLTNWEAPTLSPAQQQYAAIDAWACIRIYNHLTSGAFNPNESPYIVPETPTAAAQ